LAAELGRPADASDVLHDRAAEAIKEVPRLRQVLREVAHAVGSMEGAGSRGALSHEADLQQSLLPVQVARVEDGQGSSPSSQVLQQQFQQQQPKQQQKPLLNSDLSSLNALRAKAAKINMVEIIQNQDHFPATLARLAGHDVVVIVVMAHTRLRHLRKLLTSLRAVRGIESALLVISFDVFSEPLQQLLDGIDFCLFIRLFFPHALQLHPDSFPGQSPSDCDRDLTKAQALAKGCANANTPDTYNHYR